MGRLSPGAERGETLAVQVAQQFKIVRQRLAEADPGVDRDPLARDAGTLAGKGPRSEKRADLAHNVPVARIILHVGRAALHVHHTNGGCRAGHSLERAWKGQRTHVVHHLRTGRKGRLDHLRATRVDRHDDG